MAERFLVTSVLNGTELQRSMALRGRNSFAFRVMPSAALAETALIRCGKVPEGKLVRLNEQQFVIGSLMRRVEYFSGAFSFADAVRLTETLNAMRLRFVSDESAGLRGALSMGEFPDKNGALLEVYSLYMGWLAENGRYDDICLIRCAKEQAAVIDAEFFALDLSELSPLEKALVMRVSGGKCVSISLRELYGGQPSDALRLDSLTEVYGSVNETDRLIKDIYESGVPLDRCVVAVTDPAVYGQLFYDVAMEKGVPVAFGCGVSVTDSGPAGLLSLWKKWNETGFHGVDALQAMIYSDTFDRSVLNELLNQGRTEEEGQVPLRRLTELAGSMRLEPDAQINENRIDAWEKTLSESSEDLRMVEPLRRLGRELGLPCDAFLKKYANIRKHVFGGPLDKSALNAILDALSLVRRFPGLITMEDMIPMALEQTVNGESAEPGKLFVTTVTGALSVQRDHLYILGLSADKFPGKPRENALMLDSDWDLLPSPETSPTSRRLVEETLSRTVQLIKLANSLDIDVHAYWPDYDPADLKDLIPSSMIYHLREASGVPEDKEGYFPAVYSDAYAIGKLYLGDGRVIPAVDFRELPEDCGVDPAQREWSPSAIDAWFECKRKFLYKSILHLDISEQDDPMVVISPQESGNLAHHLMEILAAERPDEAEFRSLAASMFDEYLVSRPPMDPYAAEREKERFVRMMDSAWKSDPGREAVLSEEKLHSTHPCGLKLMGRPDRVEADGNGKYIVVDFKTGRKVEQTRDDPKSCRQTMIYAWMLQQKGMSVACCEYRYLRRSVNVPCEINPLTMGQLETDLALFNNGLISGDFGPEDGYGTPRKKNDCTYCEYKAICNSDKAREEARE